MRKIFLMIRTTESHLKVSLKGIIKGTLGFIAPEILKMPTIPSRVISMPWEPFFIVSN